MTARQPGSDGRLSSLLRRVSRSSRATEYWPTAHLDPTSRRVHLASRAMAFAASCANASGSLELGLHDPQGEADRRELIPGLLVEDTPGGLLVHPAPLLKEERNSGCEAAVANLPKDR